MKCSRHGANIVNGIAMILFYLLAITFTPDKGEAAECLRKHWDSGSFVCVCNATYCDTVDNWMKPSNGTVLSYTTDKETHRFYQQQLRLQEKPTSCAPNATGIHVKIKLDTEKLRQTIVGFGGSFTDATAINIHSLTPDTQERLKQAYFSENGLEYNLFRVPIGGSDFSTRAYTYDDDTEYDFELKNFALQPEDLEEKIPLIHDALKMSKREIKLVASSFSPPAWMKTSNSLKGQGILRGEIGGPYYDLLARYYIRFLEEYKKHGIEFYGLTTQNEPVTGFIPFYPFNDLGLTPQMLQTFVKKNIGPRLKESQFNSTKLLIYDYVRLLLWPYVEKVLNDSEAYQYVDGISVHWYSDNIATTNILDHVHDAFPAKPMIMTESCAVNAYGRYRNMMELGSWRVADMYAHFIIQNLQHWMTGWIDWNMALDTHGGPNWAETTTDAPIIVNNKTDEFYKQPLYYVMGHFSKFVPPGSVVVETWESCTKRGISSVGFITPDKTVVLVVLNSKNDLVNLHITHSNVGNFQAAIPPNALMTFLWAMK